MQWYVRALVVLGVCLMFCVPWLSIGLAGLFSAVFRWRLNRLRGLDVRYIAPWSNTYDRTVMSVTVAVRYAQYHTLWWWPDDREIGQWKDGYLSGWAWAQDDIHRAGTIAYIFDGLVFAGVLAWHLI